MTSKEEIINDLKSILLRLDAENEHLAAIKIAETLELLRPKSANNQKRPNPADCNKI